MDMYSRRLQCTEYVNTISREIGTSGEKAASRKRRCKNKSQPILYISTSQIPVALIIAYRCYSYSYISPSLSRPSTFQAHGAIVLPRLFRNGCSCSHLDLISTTFEWETPSWLLNPRCSLILTPSHGLSILFPAPVRVSVEGEPSLACLLALIYSNSSSCIPAQSDGCPGVQSNRIISVLSNRVRDDLMRLRLRVCRFQGPARRRGHLHHYH